MASIVVDSAPLVLGVGIVLLSAAVMGFGARKIGLPAVVGYLATGLIVSPFKSGFIDSYDQLSLLADIGVVLLLFEVGIEIDLRRIKREQKALIWGVPAQVAIGILIGTPVFLLLDIPLFGALLLSLSIAMSSSVVIVNITSIVDYISVITGTTNERVCTSTTIKVITTSAANEFVGTTAT